MTTFPFSHRKNDILPSELQELAWNEVKFMPYDSSITRSKPRSTFPSFETFFLLVFISVCGSRMLVKFRHEKEPNQLLAVACGNWQFLLIQTELEVYCDWAGPRKLL
jgi:hypothetical protein